MGVVVLDDRKKDDEIHPLEKTDRQMKKKTFSYEIRTVSLLTE
jgi:hypothetical protein